MEKDNNGNQTSTGIETGDLNLMETIMLSNDDYNPWLYGSGERIYRHLSWVMCVSDRGKTISIKNHRIITLILVRIGNNSMSLFDLFGDVRIITRTWKSCETTNIHFNAGTITSTDKIQLPGFGYTRILAPPVKNLGQKGPICISGGQS